MMHNNTIDLTKVLENVEGAIFSKLLILNQGSGRCEQHAGQFADLVRAKQVLLDMMAAQQPKAEESKVKKTQ